MKNFHNTKTAMLYGRNFSKQQNNIRAYLTFLIFAICLFSTFFMNAQMTTWNGSVDSDWFNASNWSNGIPSTSTTRVNIPNTANNPIIKTGETVTTRAINVEGGTLTIEVGATMDLDNAVNEAGFRCTGGATVNNAGTIMVDNTSGTDAIGCAVGGTLNNTGTIEIGLNGGNIGNSFKLFIDTITGIINNHGIMRIEDGETSILSAGTFTNESCGQLFADGTMAVFFGAHNFVNNGYYRTEGGIDNMINNGIVEDTQHHFPGTAINNDLVVAPISNVGCTFPNAIDVGSANSFTIGTTWYTDNTLSTAAGTYDAATNTFTPNGSLSLGISTLYMEIIDNGSSCVSTVGIEVTYSAATNPLYVDTDATGNNDGSSWADAFNDLQDALDIPCNVFTEIWVAEGTYLPTEAPDGSNNSQKRAFHFDTDVHIYGGFDGTETLLSQRDVQNHVTTLSGNIGAAGNDDNAFHVVMIQGTSNAAVLDGFTITGGNADGGGNTNYSGANFVNENGGGIYIHNADVMISNCIIDDNAADEIGGGIIATNGANPTIANSIIRNNEVGTIKDGAAIATASSATPSISNCLVIENGGLLAGSIIYTNSASPQFINCTITDNENVSSGIIDCENNANVTFTNSIISETAIPVANGASTGGNSLSFQNCNLKNSGPVVSATYGTDLGGNIDADPMFTDAANADYTLTVCSALIDAGLTSANTTATDLGGNARFFNTTIDIGAYESNDNTPCCTNTAGSIIYVKSDAIGAANGTSWADAYTNLQDAIAQVCTASTDIWVAAGTYYADTGAGQTDNDRAAYYVMKNNLRIIGGLAGTEAPSFDLNTRDFVTNATILSGDIDQDGTLSNNSYGIFNNYKNSLNSTAVLDGFTLTGVNRDNFTGIGHAISNDAVSPTILNCLFTNNSTDIEGAAMINLGGNPVVTNCAFVGNTANGYGGAVRNSSYTQPVFTNCTFEGNQSINQNGGGMASFLGSEVTLYNCVFWNNKDKDGIDTPQASYRITGTAGALSSATFTNCLVQGMDLSSIGTNNLDGTNPANDPVFVQETDFNDPTVIADAHLDCTTTVANIGSNAANTLPFDLDGNTRVFGSAIDLGAYELQTTVGNTITCYADADNDTYGDANTSITACATCPSGYVLDNTDCDDTNNTVYPNAPELCDGLDNNCNNMTDEGAQTTYYADTDNDGFGDANNSMTACSQPAGFVTNDTDCDDTNNTVYPNAPELCDGLDNNCNNMTDEGVQTIYYADTDNDGFGDANNSMTACSQPAGYVTDNTDCDDTNNTVYPNAPELCDGLDNNCNNMTDEGAQTTYYADTDDDGFGDANNSMTACSQPAGYVTDNTDCNDNNNTVYPGAPELCDGVDNNCDGNNNEGISGIVYVDIDATGNNDGTSWANAFTDLQNGLDYACGTEVWVAEGTYIPTEIPNSNNTGDRFKAFHHNSDLQVYGGFDGTETMLTERDPIAHLTTLSGELGAAGIADNALHVWVVGGNSGNRVIDGFTVSGGNASAPSTYQYAGSPVVNNYGGGIYTNNTPFIIRNCIFENNRASQGGGGFASYGNANTTIDRSIFRNNTSSVGGGCGTNFGTINISNSLIHNNTASIAGGINVRFTSTLNAVNVTFVDNQSANSSAVYGDGTSVSNIDNCIVHGGLNSTNASTINVQNSNVINSNGSGANWNTNRGNDLGGNIDEDPCFTDAANDNYTLQSCSPSINTGDNNLSSTTLDLVGNGRVFDTTVDMGAYEYQGTTTALVTCYADTDNDGFGDPNNSMKFCDTCGTGFVSNDDDCDDTNNAINPNATEVPDGVDNNCDGNTDETGISTILYVDADAPGNNTGTNWANAYNSLQDALIDASNNPAIEEIWIADGTYTPSSTGDQTASFVLGEGCSLIGGFAGGETSASDADPFANATILSGDLNGDDVLSTTDCATNASENSLTVVVVPNSVTAATMISGLTVVSGNAVGGITSPLSQRAGGGVDVHGSPVFEFMTFSNNCASTGAGVYVFGLNAVIAPEFRNCKFINNHSLYGGAGVYNDGRGSGMNEATFYCCEFTNNVSGSAGGAVYNDGSIGGDCSTTFVNGTFAGNAATNGGAAMLNHYASPTISNSIFSDNSATMPITDQNSTVNITNSIVEGNYQNQSNVDPQYMVCPSCTPNSGAWNVQLQATSPAINAGSNVALPAYITKDANGQPRISGTSVDLGAYENQVAALPVELSNFSARANGELTALLTWQTLSETNNKGFDIERSANGKDWQSIGYEGGRGNSNELVNYTFKDNNAKLGINYYRLAQEDLDGTITYSNIETVRFTGSQLNLYPNPTQDEIYIDNLETDGLTQIRIIDIQGKLIYAGSIEVENGSMHLQVRDLNVLSAGTYFIELTQANQHEQLRFVKTN